MLVNIVPASNVSLMLVNDVSHVPVNMLGPISTYGCSFICYWGRVGLITITADFKEGVKEAHLNINEASGDEQA